MAVIGTVLAAMAPTAKAVALQVALQVGTDVATNYIGEKLGNDSGQLAGQAINAIASENPTQALTDLGTNFVTDQLNQKVGVNMGDLANQTVQALLNNDTDTLAQLGTDQVNQVLQLLAQQQSQNLIQPGQQGTTQGNANQMHQQPNQAQPNHPGLLRSLAMGGAGLGATALNAYADARKPPAHLDPNNAPAERIFLPAMKEGLFTRPAPKPTAVVNHPLITPNNHLDNNVLENKGRYRV